jgi:hypothetical protein
MRNEILDFKLKMPAIFRGYVLKGVRRNGEAKKGHSKG